MAPYKPVRRLGNSKSRINKPRRGPNLGRTSKRSASAYDVLGSLITARKDFDKQVQLFGLHGVSLDQARLRDGTIIEKGSCIEIDQGKDYSKTSYKGERWFAQVIEIKSLGEKNRFYLLCYWYYSEINVNRLGVTVGNLTRCPFSRNELVLSNHKQVISSEAVLGKINIHFFNELERDQDPIGLNDFWYRFNLRLGPGIASTRLVQGTNGHLPPARCSIETCSIRYKPDQQTQRLCPRPGCGFWYHEKCLKNLGFTIRQKEIKRSQRLPAMLYATEEGTNWVDDAGDVHEHLPPLFYSLIHEGIEEEEGGDEPTFPLYDREKVGSIINITWCAKTPIKRGCKAGIVGNEAIVKKARQLLREMWDLREGDSFGYYPNEDEVAMFKDCKEPLKERLFRCVYCNWVI